jgi:hypothetical protein
MAKEAAKPPVRITNQFRKGQAMVYDLTCEEVRLTLEVSAGEANHGAERWRVEAFARQAVDKESLVETATTRRDALTSIATAWTSKRGASSFPAIDWNAVADALVAVRAI